MGGSELGTGVVIPRNLVSSRVEAGKSLPGTRGGECAACLALAELCLCPVAWLQTNLKCSVLVLFSILA